MMCACITLTTGKSGAAEKKQVTLAGSHPSSQILTGTCFVQGLLSQIRGGCVGTAKEDFMDTKAYLINETGFI